MASSLRTKQGKGHAMSRLARRIRIVNETKCQPEVPDRDSVRAALREIVDAEPAIVAAYLFGSLAHDAAGPLSDVDIALLIRNREERRVVCERAMDALCRRLHTSRVDVVSLADAPAPLRYRIVRQGALVVCRDPAVLQRFVTETVLDYLDFKPLRDQAFAVMRESILADR